MTSVLAIACTFPALARAQRPTLTLTPHADVVVPGTFYRGPMITGATATRYEEGTVRLGSFVGWGARLALRPAGSPWALELDGTTGTTDASAAGHSGGLSTSFSLNGKPARLSVFSLGVAHALRTIGSGTLTGRLGGTLASTTMQQRIYRPPSPSQGGYTLDPFEQLKPWSRRYVSPGGEAGVSMSLPTRGGLALLASGTLGVVRNETGDMGANTTSTASPSGPRREAYWMPVFRLTLGVGLSR